MSKKMHDAAIRQGVASKFHSPVVIHMLDDELQKLRKYERRIRLIKFLVFLNCCIVTALFLYFVGITLK